MTLCISQKLLNDFYKNRKYRKMFNRLQEKLFQGHLKSFIFGILYTSLIYETEHYKVCTIISYTRIYINVYKDKGQMTN